jgi:hypothetical protein
LRTFPGASLRPGSLGFNPDTPRCCLSTPTDAFERHPDVRSYRTTPTRDGSPARRRLARRRDETRARTAKTRTTTKRILLSYRRITLDPIVVRSRV